MKIISKQFYFTCNHGLNMHRENLTKLQAPFTPLG